MANSPYDGLYWDTHVPLGLYKSLHDLMGRNTKNPNTPNATEATTDRQWLSMPRGASSYQLKHNVYTFADSDDLFTADGIRTTLGNNNRTRDYGKDLDQAQTGYGAMIARSLDPKVFNWFPVAYSSTAFPLNIGINAAVDKAVAMILSNSAKIFLIGFGKGAVVTSKLYDEFRTGRLMSRRSDLLAIYNFGNPMREAGHTIPGGIDTGGHGISPANERLVDTEELVWEFAAPGDPISNTGDDIAGEIATLVYTYYDRLITSPQTLNSQLMELINSPIFGKLPVLLPFRLAVSSGELLDVPKLLRTLIREFFSDGGTHDRYQEFYPYADKRINAVDAAIIAIQNATLANPPAVINSSETEVLTINYRQPVSISEVSFEILRKNCYTELWYLDRSNNWRQLLNENSSPISVRVGHSESLDWYKHKVDTYPVVAKAIRFRIVRVADPYIGNDPYPVGVRNILVRRNVYNRSAGLQGLDDETDTLGNIVSKTIKDWDAAKAVDDNANTFWKSAPQPDPNAVVNFYLDTRDSAGNAQLIDKVYLDPVYAGQSLNLYYSNDGTITSKKLNPASVIPIAEYQIGATTATSGTGSTATLTLDVAPNLSVGDEVTISGVSPSAYNGTHTLSAVSRSAKTISFSSTATGSQSVAGVITTKGQSNFEWIRGKGLKDIVPEDTDNSIYMCPFSIGPMVSQDCWVGVQWTPSFNSYSQKSNIIPISTKEISKVGGTANVILSAAPNVSVGEKVTLSGVAPSGYNGTYTVTDVSNTEPYRVSFDTATTGSQTQSGVLVTDNFNAGIKDISTTAATGNGTTATLTLASDPKVAAGDLITVSGMTPSGYNGTYTVTAATSSSVSYASAATGAQTVAGTVSTNARIKIVGITSPTFANIHSVYDVTTKDLLYSKARDYSSSTFNGTTKVLRVPAGSIPARCVASDNIVIYYGTSGPVPTQLDLIEVMPDITAENQYWPRIFYDTSTAEIVLEMLRPTGASVIHRAPLSNLFEAGTPINIVVGWRYVSGASPTVYISARTNRQLPLAALEISNPAFPTNISIDGKIGFRQWRGTFGAHIVKQESYQASSESFLANPTVYCNPDPVLIAPSSTTAPSSPLDQAVIAVDWTSQQFAAGGAHSSSYSDKEWTPIWVNYFAEKGFLYLPETTSMKYLKLEFSQLTPEPYPVYDQGIKVMYQTFPLTITQTTSQTRGLLGYNNYFGGIGSVNWLNPSSVNQAVNSVYGRTVQPVQTTLQVGQGTITDVMPNTTSTAIVEATRTEASSPWIYRRTPPTAGSLVVNFFESAFIRRTQGTKAAVSSKQAQAIETQTAITRPTSSTPSALPVQGDDWYIFPGQTLRMPANVINGLTKSQVITRRDRSKAVRTRFTATAVHQYEVKTVTLDANIAYFAGIREVQPYVVTYVDYEDPPEFSFDTYDSTTGWSSVNIEKLATGPITAKENPYSIPNSRFNATLNYWTGDGWSWDTSEGYSLDETWQPGTPFMYGSAHTVANGTNRTLLSEPIDIEDGAAYIKLAAWVVYRDLTYTTGAKVYVDLVGLDENGAVVSSAISLGTHMEVKEGVNSSGIAPHYYFSDNQPCSSVAQLGVKAVPLFGSVDLSAVSSSIKKFRVRLNVNSSVTAGNVWFDDIDVTPNAGIIGSAQKTITTHAKFCKVRCDFNDSGIKRSDPMWMYLDSDDPRRTILTHYVTTVPSSIPDGSWSDSFGTWSSSEVEWGTPYSVVAINYSEAVFDKKRVIHFYRESSSLESTTSQAGIAVRQTLNFVPKGLFRICTTFFKEKKTANTMQLRLTRVSGDETGPDSPDQYANGIVHTENLKNLPTGQWHTHQGQWMEIPDSMDQVYKVELTLSGNEEDDIYLNDLWIEIAQVRYHVQLGGGRNHDVTPLVYQDNCTVSTTDPVNSMVVSVEIYGNNSFLLGSVEKTQLANETTATVSISVDDPNVLTGIDYIFTANDVGKYAWIDGAGGTGKSLRTTIIGIDEGKAILANPCLATVTSVRGAFGNTPNVSKQNTSFAYSSSFTPLYLQ